MLPSFSLPLHLLTLAHIVKKGLELFSEIIWQKNWFFGWELFSFGNSKIILIFYWCLVLSLLKWGWGRLLKGKRNQQHMKVVFMTASFIKVIKQFFRGDGYISGRCTLNCVRDSAIEMVNHKSLLIQSMNLWWWEVGDPVSQNRSVSPLQQNS